MQFLLWNQSNYFISEWNYGNRQIVSISLFHSDIISSKIYEDGALSETLASIFSKNCFEKMQVDGATYATFP